MHQTIVPNSGPKLKLVEAAEKLFAERGFDVVSVRDITQAAGSNVAAVNYHFGSRDGLVAVVMNRYITPINEVRLARLDELERQSAGRPIPAEKVLEAIVLPLIDHIQLSPLSEMLFCKLIGRIFGMHGALPAEIEVQFSVLINRLRQLLGKSLPWLTHEELVWRLHYTMGGLVHMLTHSEALERVADGAAGAPTMATSVARFLKWAAAGMREGEAPVVEEPVAEQPPPGPLAPAESPSASILVSDPLAEETEVPTAPLADESSSNPAEEASEDAPETAPRRRAKKPDTGSPQVFFDF